MKKVLQIKLAQLNKETEEIFESIEELEQDFLQDTRNGWSIIQVLNHLQTAEAGSLLYMKKKIQAGDSMGRVKPIYNLKMALSKAALTSSLKWRAPKQVANPDGNFTLKELKENWKKVREDLDEYVRAYPEKWLDRAVYKHPMAGRQGLKGAIDSFIYHQRHHVHQLNRIRKKLTV